ncbi:MAG: glycoside hydrolase family 172 protein [Planctomycetota bacterium]
MRRAFLLILAAGCLGCAIPPSARSPLAGLTQWHDQATVRFSSADPTGGNRDYVLVPPGQAHVLMDDPQGGVIEHIWLTIDPGFEVPQGLRKFVLRMFFDGASTPCVEAPVGDFFGLPHGVRANTTSLPLVVSAEGRAMNCFWPMPYRHAARVTITNESASDVLLYYNITVARPRDLAPDVLVFHARYHQEWPPRAGRDYQVLEAAGRGQFVGCVLGVQQVAPGWFGEGDERIVVDDQPPLRGTGTEDYFLDAWDLREGESLYYGFPLSTGEEVGSLHALHRFHVEDPIPFARHFVFDLEHWGRVFDAHGKLLGNGERFDRFSSVAYWYQDEPHHDWGGVPSVGERVLARVSEDPRFTPSGTIAASRLGAVAHGGVLTLDAGEIEEPRVGERWRFTPEGDGATVEVQFSIAQEGSYAIEAEVITHGSGGRYAPTLDAQALASEVDTYAADRPQRRTVHLGSMRLSPGEHRMSWRHLGRSPYASGSELWLHAVVVRAVPTRS